VREDFADRTDVLRGTPGVLLCRYGFGQLHELDAYVVEAGKKFGSIG
jgi:hypothetical protein